MAMGRVLKHTRQKKPHSQEVTVGPRVLLVFGDKDE